MGNWEWDHVTKRAVWCSVRVESSLLWKKTAIHGYKKKKKEKKIPSILKTNTKQKPITRPHLCVTCCCSSCLGLRVLHLLCWRGIDWCEIRQLTGCSWPCLANNTRALLSYGWRRGQGAKALCSNSVYEREMVDDQTGSAPAHLYYSHWQFKSIETHLAMQLNSSCVAQYWASKVFE